MTSGSITEGKELKGATVLFHFPDVDSIGSCIVLPSEASLEPNPGSQVKRLLILTSGLEKDYEMPPAMNEGTCEIVPPAPPV